MVSNQSTRPVRPEHSESRFFRASESSSTCTTIGGEGRFGLLTIAESVRSTDGFSDTLDIICVIRCYQPHRRSEKCSKNGFFFRFLSVPIIYSPNSARALAKARRKKR